MLARCTNPNNKAFIRYAGRGIKVCERWHSFENFLADMGPKPFGMMLDRIDNNGNYEPSNCRWASRKEQARNTRRNIVVTYNGTRMSLPEAIEKSGLPYTMVITRVHRGWPEDKWFTPTR